MDHEDYIAEDREARIVAPVYRRAAEEIALRMWRCACMNAPLLSESFSCWRIPFGTREALDRCKDPKEAYRSLLATHREFTSLGGKYDVVHP